MQRQLPSRTDMANSLLTVRNITRDPRIKSIFRVRRVRRRARTRKRETTLRGRGETAVSCDLFPKNARARARERERERERERGPPIAIAIGIPMMRVRNIISQREILESSLERSRLFPRSSFD